MNRIVLDSTHFPPIRDIGLTYTKKGWTHPDRIVDYNVFIYVIEGQMQVFEDGIDYVLKEGDCFFLKSGIHHWGDQRTLPGTSTYWIHFYDPVSLNNGEVVAISEHTQQHLMYPSFRMFSSDHYLNKLLLPKKMSVKNAPYMIRKLKELYEMYNSSRSFRFIHLSMGVMDIFLELISQSEDNAAFSKSDTIVRKLLVYLEEHCMAELDTVQIGNTLQLNYRYITTLFKNKVGTSIFKYHERLRIHRAAELLKTTTLNISEVSDQAGFQSPFYFSRVFKKVIGESPSDYIKNIYRK
jgi:AraC family transcriptional regulator, arabinose operon regulatory protein